MRSTQTSFDVGDDCTTIARPSFDAGDDCTNLHRSSPNISGDIAEDSECDNIHGDTGDRGEPQVEPDS